MELGKLLKYRCLLMMLALAPITSISARETFPRAQPVGFTWGELAVLPEYCKDTQGTVWDTHGNGGPESPDLPRWIALMGEDFLNLHHYCYAIRDLRKAEAVGDATPAGRNLIGQALRDIGYVIRTCRPSMPLMPEVFLRQGDAYLRLGNVMEAKASFERSRELKPDYWPAYTRWSDVLVGLRQYDSARTLIQEALRNSPDEPELKKRLITLDARPEKPAPVNRPTKKASAVSK